MAKGTVALVLAALFGAFTVYMAMWNNDRHHTDYCDKSSQSEMYAQNCAASTEDRYLMLGSGAITIGLLGLGLVRRYQPSGRADNAARPPTD